MSKNVAVWTLVYGSVCVGCVQAPAPQAIDVLWSVPGSTELQETSPHELAESDGFPDRVVPWNDTATIAELVPLTCTTSVVLGLGRQLVHELNCLAPDTLVSIEDVDGVTYGPAVLPYMQHGAARALRKIMRGARQTLTINSALRTLPQQFMLYSWFRAGRCRISAAAEPDRSNHQSGLALDIQQTEAMRTSFTAQGYRWIGSFDRVHYDYVRGGEDLRELSVLAFQRLWNRAHPEDRIAEDGSYGPMTANRLAASPAAGFAVSTACETP